MQSENPKGIEDYNKGEIELELDKIYNEIKGKMH